MKVFNFLLILSAIQLNAQEIIFKTNFPVRDFFIEDSTVVYIEKRSVKSYNMQTNRPDTLFKNNDFFVGGYGLKVFKDSTNNKIITASNELIRDISSIRFYDIATKAVNKYHVYYTTEIMDFLIIPSEKLFFLSKKNLQIQVLKYGGKQRYILKDSIKLDAFSRKMSIYNENLFYITDSGKLFRYNFKSHEKKLIFKGNEMLVNFVINKKTNQLFITNIKGDLISLDLKDKYITKKIKLGNTITEAIKIVDDKHIVTGDWNGHIYVIDQLSLDILKQYNNKSRIIHIDSIDDEIYTSSVDCTIKKWSIN